VRQPRDLLPPPKRQSNARRDLISQEILEKAAALFAERGFANTSLQDVAQALGIGRTALYHYISSKDELLASLVRGLTQETAEAVDAIAGDSTLTPAAKLEAAVRGMAARVAGSPARFRLLLVSEGSLSKPLAAEHRQARRRVLRGLTAIVREGIEAGVLRETDEQVAAFGVLGMCNWIAWWHEPGADPAPAVDELVRLALDGLRVPEDRAPTGPAGIEHALELLHRDLSYLERSVAERKTDST
jgi:AcrR family transcriptional regulator